MENQIQKILTNADLTASEKLVLITLTLKTKGEYKTLSQDEIAEGCSTTIRTVTSSVKSLEQKGFLNIVKANRGKAAKHEYKVVC